MDNQSELLCPVFDLEDLVLAFNTSISQPDTPCSKLLLGSIFAMRRPGLEIDDICRRFPRVLRILMRIFIRDPDQTLRDLHRGWHYHADCDCEYDPHPLVCELRDFAERIIGSAVHFLAFQWLHYLTLPLFAALVPIEKQLSDKTIRSTWNRLDSKCWPTSPADLSPNGIDRTVEGLLSWPLCLTTSARRAGYNPLDLGGLLRKPLLLLAVIENISPVRSGAIGHRLFPRTILATLDLLLVQEEMIVVPSLDRVHRVQTALDNCNELLPIMRLFSRTREIDLQAFVYRAVTTHKLDAFLTAISDLLGAVSQWTRILGFDGDLEAADSPCRWILRGFALAAAAVLRQLGRSPDSMQYHSLIGRICHGTFSRARGNPFYLVTSPLGRLYQEDICCRRECHKSGAMASSPLALCSGCEVARYCSKDCQRAAWRDQEGPHRGACEDLAAFKRLVYPTGSYPLGFRAWLHLDELQAMQAHNELAWRVFNHVAYTLDDAVIHVNTFLVEPSPQASSTPEDPST